MEVPTRPEALSVGRLSLLNFGVKISRTAKKRKRPRSDCLRDQAEGGYIEPYVIETRQANEKLGESHPRPPRPKPAYSPVCVLPLARRRPSQLANKPPMQARLATPAGWWAGRSTLANDDDGKRGGRAVRLATAVA